METDQKKVLLHCCCGPCSSASVERLLNLGYEVVLFFGNSNIYPKEEADKRFGELEKVAKAYNLQVIRRTQNHADWLAAIKSLEGEVEGARRCDVCFQYNLREASQLAEELNIPYFTTTLTISVHKSSPKIFTVGSEFEGFLPIDFKKQGGFSRSLELAKKLDLYRQNYCGCEFSLVERDRRLAKKV